MSEIVQFKSDTSEAGEDIIYSSAKLRKFNNVCLPPTIQRSVTFRQFEELYLR